MTGVYILNSEPFLVLDRTECLIKACASVRPIWIIQLQQSNHALSLTSETRGKETHPLIRSDESLAFVLPLHVPGM